MACNRYRASRNHARGASFRSRVPRSGLALLCSILLAGLGPRGAVAQVNLLATATLEDFGTQQNAGGLAAPMVHDQDLGTRWQSEDPTELEYFIFSFPRAIFSRLNLYNAPNDKAVRFFRLFHASDPAVANDPNHGSWIPVPSSGTYANDAHNVINIRLGARMERFGSEKDATTSAERIADGTTVTEWQSATGSSNDYFILSFENETVTNVDRFMLYNDVGQGVKRFRIYSATDPAAKADRNHASWIRIGGTYTAAKSLAPQVYTFSPVNAAYFQFEFIDGYHASQRLIREIELYGDKTLGDASVWRAERTDVGQQFDFSARSGEYLMFLVGGNYDNRQTSIFELQLMGSQGGLSVQKWREVIR